MNDHDLAKIKEAVAGARHGPKGCLLLKTEDVAALIARLEAAEARNATAYAEGVEEAAKVAENYSLMRHIAQDQHTGTFPNSSPVHTYLAQDIRSLLKDKPNG